MGFLRHCACCSFGPLPCCILCCKQSRESTTTRLCYTLILFTVVVLSLLSHEGGWMGKLYLQYREDLDGFCSKLNAGDGCRRFAGFIAIYRLCFPLFVFHFLMAILMIGVSSSQTVRGKIHNGFWIWKVIFLLISYFLAYSFPILERWTEVWMIIGIIGGFVFIYIQHITLIDFAYEINGVWHSKARKSIGFAICIFVVTLGLYLATAGAYACFIIFYGLPQQCTLNLTVTGINGGLTALLAICSVFSNTLRKKQLWLPGAVTSAFVAFLTWSALGSQPRILSSDVPWQRRAVNNMDKKANVTLHPLLVAADHLNRLLSDQFSVQSDKSSAVRGPTVTLPTIMINQCLPGGISSISDHLGKDIFMILGLLLVIGGSLYSSFRATMQARRIGIRTHRERLKQLLTPIAEQPELSDRAPSKGIKKPAGIEPEPEEEYVSKKKIKQQERILNRLEEAVAALPNPKVFRRPSARQPRPQKRNNAQTNSTANPSPSKTKTTVAQLSHEDGVPLINLAVTAPDPFTGTTLRVASSVPDLSSTMRRLSRAAQRPDITQFQWTPLQLPPSEELNAPPTDDRSISPMSSSGPSKTSAQIERSKRVRNGTIRPHDLAQCRMPTGQIGKRRRRQNKEDKLLQRLTQFTPDAFPEKNAEPRRTSLIEVAFPSQPDGQVFPPAKRTPHSPLPKSGAQPSIGLDELDSSAWSSPNHLRFQRARSVSELVVSPPAIRLLESYPNLVASLAFLKPMLNDEAPHDDYVRYNEAIASVYSYAWFHFIYALSSLYLMTQLTNWYNPQISRVETLSGSWATMWMKLVSSWLALLLYAWTIACPRLCIGRKLTDTPFTTFILPEKRNIVLSKPILLIGGNWKIPGLPSAQKLERFDFFFLMRL